MFLIWKTAFLLLFAAICAGQQRHWQAEMIRQCYNSLERSWQASTLHDFISFESPRSVSLDAIDQAELACPNLGCLMPATL